MDAAFTARFAVDYWKLLRAFERTSQRLPPDQRARAVAQLRYSATRLDSLLREVQMELVTFEGRPFDPSLPASPLNSDDFEGTQELIVESTVEPAIVRDMSVVLMGKVILRSSRTGADNVSGN